MTRVNIGRNFSAKPGWKVVIGVPLIYVPLFATIPFIAIGALLVRLHLHLVGGQDIKSFWDFVPEWVSHRYRYHDQIVYRSGSRWHSLKATRWFWIFNCKLYCPLSVALFRYMVYLVMVVENWWCPFHHDQKPHYCDSAIDKSYWHLHEHEKQALHPDDLNNAIWNEQADNLEPVKKNHDKAA